MPLSSALVEEFIQTCDGPHKGSRVIPYVGYSAGIKVVLPFPSAISNKHLDLRESTHTYTGKRSVTVLPASS